ncbi:conjugal transfer protein TraC [Catellatospora sp. NPDC049111]|uniref:VirB4 family type IV secretion system protein n=1 Tax=Catellatospora sp. NPDC049111 TaxID=3155271 RepID=UPI0033EC0389
MNRRTRPVPQPSGVHVHPDHLGLGLGVCASFAVVGYPAEVGPTWLEPLLSWPGRLDVAVHLQPVDPATAATRLRRQRARFESGRRIAEVRGALSDPYLDAAADDATVLAEQVARGATKLFQVGLYLTVHATTQPELADACRQVRAAAASVLLDAQPTTFRQTQAWTSTLPLGVDDLRMTRTMDTTSLAAAFPLACADLPQPLPGDPTPAGGVLYGTNPATGGIVWWDRFAQDNHNTVVLARSGAGKSYLIKLDTLRSLYQGTQVSVIDPEDEYTRLAHAVGGTVIALGAPGVRVNPFDIPTGDTRPDAYTRRLLFAHTATAVLLGSHELTPADRAALDRALIGSYRNAGITADPDTWHRPAPLLGDLAAALAADPDPAATQLAARLAPWTSGSHRHLFDGPTTHTPDSHLTVWSLRHLPDELRTIGTLLALDAIWRTVDTPPPPGTRPPKRIVVVDEAWLLMRDGEGARFLHRMAKAARKRHAGLTVVTQDAADLLGTDLGLAVVSNAATQILMRQAPQAIDTVTDTFALTAGERHYLLTAGRGQGLLLGAAGRTGFQQIASATEHQLVATGLEFEGNDDQY